MMTSSETSVNRKRDPNEKIMGDTASKDEESEDSEKRESETILETTENETKFTIPEPRYSEFNKHRFQPKKRCCFGLFSSSK